MFNIGLLFVTLGALTNVTGTNNVVSQSLVTNKVGISIPFLAYDNIEGECSGVFNCEFYFTGDFQGDLNTKDYTINFDTIYSDFSIALTNFNGDDYLLSYNDLDLNYYDYLGDIITNNNGNWNDNVYIDYADASGDRISIDIAYEYSNGYEYFMTRNDFYFSGYDFYEIYFFDDYFEFNFVDDNTRNNILSLFNYTDNYNIGYDVGYNNGYNEGVNVGYSNGYNIGYNDALEVDSTAVTIFSGILSIAMVPINFFLSIFNFEILGINMASFVSALLTVCVIIIVIKMISGKGNE